MCHIGLLIWNIYRKCFIYKVKDQHVYFPVLAWHLAYTAPLTPTTIPAGAGPMYCNLLRLYITGLHASRLAGKFQIWFWGPSFHDLGGGKPPKHTIHSMNVSVFLAGTQTCFQLAFVNQSGVWFSWTGSVGRPKNCLCAFLQTMWFCFRNQNISFSMQWGSLHLSVHWGWVSLDLFHKWG